ncbi:GLUTAMYL-AMINOPEPTIDASE [Encephalitozoon cuniculi GB-M1]|uniref:Probable M1 family aminopeptidase 1 n=1 Tax=Encephalitozoon cuniculi (strain GB-M1) TaxID=284813 RepID=AMP11_ENCCU|nr:uncharacterized protein ECU01_0140 [Encephalitozoon cuniculi GB-M1]NP_001402233.1 uncharacterized protein ECU01_1470 [Encephalitozoon cuniculi GB-M1]Q8SQI6.1 RecName: Full=Probable M1 family aminopeptidase 1 [Encephalitozoon cuniculi GB-M1]CAD24886.1 GLUTAMYL-AMINOPEPTIDASE [Encephalitozoon cuniculi GB-M1]CAD25018.1 GLUTAMYL-AMINOPEPTIDASE [Encephalitozoon cuniculi GB-M1]
MRWIKVMAGLLPMIGSKGADEKDSSQQRRLSRVVVPEHYDLHVKILDAGFCGSVGIRVMISQDVSEIVLNAKELEIRDAGIVVEGARIPGRVVVGEAEKELEVVRIVFPSSLRAGPGYLTMEFCGDYSNGLVGLYKSGGPKEVYSTHFEPTDARRAFPCFDQPDMKATFKISIDAGSKFTVLANTQAIPSLREEYGDRKIEYFEETCKMSTYLVAFVVGELSYIEDWSKDGVRLRVYGDSSEVEWGRYGLEVGKRCLEYFSEYFGVGYEFPRAGSAKIDMVGIPNFSSGAMENWGLITFRRESLLYVPGKSNVEDMKNVAGTVCHELGHMWFGNLVTMSWWDDLWLNEGFATWVSFKGMENIGSVVSWDVWGEFVLWNVVRGMVDDGLGKSHQIRMNVTDPGEIGEIFDSISYCKGASVIRMIERYVGESVFMLGIRRYIKEHMYGNGNAMSLWKAIGEEYGEDISEMVEGWISQAGYPVVSVQDCGSSLVLSQSRYSMLGKSDDSLWTIPVVVSWEGKGQERIELRGRETTVRKRSSVYKVNAEYGGFYRVLYDSAGLSGLESRIDSLSVVDRVNVIEDVFGLGFGLYGGLEHGLRRISEYYSDSYHVARSGIEKLLRLRSVFYDDAEIVSLIDKKVRKMILPCVGRIDVFDIGTSVESVSMNKYVLSVGVEVGIREAVEKVQELWRRHVEAGEELGELRWIVYKAVVDENLGYMMDKYKNGDTPGMRREVMNGFSGIKREENFLDVVGNLSQFSVEDIGVVIGSISRGGAFRDAMVEYVVSHGEELYLMVHKNAMLYNMIIMSLRHVSGDLIVEKVERFLSGIKHSGSNLSIEKVRNEIQWRRRMRGIREEVLRGLLPEAEK